MSFTTSLLLVWAFGVAVILAGFLEAWDEDPTADDAPPWFMALGLVLLAALWPLFVLLTAIAVLAEKGSR
jgi:hypothetical protein